MKKLLATVLFYGIMVNVNLGQDFFNAVYPIGNQANIGYKTSMVPDIEKMYFEANPILRMPFYNNFRRRFMNGDPSGSSLYFGFEPQIRMYNDVSKPIKMPSYKISLLGYQQMFRLPK